MVYIHYKQGQCADYVQNILKNLAETVVRDYNPYCYG